MSPEVKVATSAGSGPAGDYRIGAPAVAGDPLHTLNVFQDWEPPAVYLFGAEQPVAPVEVLAAVDSFFGPTGSAMKGALFAADHPLVRAHRPMFTRWSAPALHSKEISR